MYVPAALYFQRMLLLRTYTVKGKEVKKFSFRNHLQKYLLIPPKDNLKYVYISRYDCRVHYINDILTFHFQRHILSYNLISTLVILCFGEDRQRGL